VAGKATENEIETAEKKAWGRPRVSPCSERELHAFRGRIEELLGTVSYSPEELDYALGYSPRGRMTRQLPGGRQPSRPYAEKLGRLERNPPSPKPTWTRRAPKILAGEAIPVFMLETEQRRCLECMAVQPEGGDVDQPHFFAGIRDKWCTLVAGVPGGGDEGGFVGPRNWTASI
jgi:hypothetical protein